jgi:O-antigen/teichoic acid export membrane protein
MVFPAIRRHLVRHFPPGTLRARVASGAVWVLFGMGASQLVAALSSIVIARVLGKDSFGEFGMVRNTIMMLGVLAGLGLGLTTNKFVAEYRDKDPARASRVLGLTLTLGFISGTLVSAWVALGADYLAARTLNAAHLAPYIRICAPLLLMSVVNGVQMAAISGLEQFRILAWLTAVTVLTAAVTSAVGAVGWGIQGALYGTVLGGFINVLILEAVGAPLRRTRSIPVAFRGIWQERDIIFSFAVPSMFSGLMVGPITWAALRLLFIRPDGPGQTAVFNAANQIRALALFVPGAIAQVVMPMFSNLQAGSDSGRYQRAVRLSSLACLAAGLAVALPLIVASRQIMALFGPGFSGGWVVLCLLCLAAVLQATNTVIGEALAALNKMWWGFLLNCLWAAEFLLASWFLVRLGAIGLGWAYLISYVLHTLQVWAFVLFAIRRHPEWRVAPVRVPVAGGEWA